MPDEIIGEAKVKISYSDLQALDRQVDSTGKKFIGQFDKMDSKTKMLTKGLGALGGVIAGIGVAKFGNDIFQASLKMENLNKMLVANEGSQKKANEAMAKYLQMAKSPGLNLSQITQGMTQLKALGVSATQAERTIMALGNQMVLSGRGAEEFGRVMVQIQQSIGKGKIMAEDLRVIAESMPMVRKLMKDAFGEVDTEKLAKMGITAIDFWTRLTEQMEKSPKAIGGTQNSIDNFKDSLLQFEAALGKNLLPTIGRFLDRLTDMMDGFNNLPESIKSTLGTSVLTGGGLLAVGAALAFIVKTGGDAIKTLKEVGGVNIGNGMSGAVGTAGKIGATAFAAGSVAWAVREIYLSATNVNIVGGAIKAANKEFGQAEKDIIHALRQAMTEQGLSRSATIREWNAPYQAKAGLFGKAGLNWQSMQGRTFDYLLNILGEPLYTYSPLNIEQPPSEAAFNVPESEQLKNFLYGQLQGLESMYGGMKPRELPTRETTTPSNATALNMPAFGLGPGGMPFPSSFDMSGIMTQMKIAEDNKKQWELIARLNDEDNKKQIEADKQAIARIEEKNKAEINGLEAIQAIRDNQIKRSEDDLKDQLRNIEDVGDEWNKLTKDLAEAPEKKIKPAWDDLLDGIANATEEKTKVMDSMFREAMYGLANEFDKLFKKSSMENVDADKKRPWYDRLLEWAGPHLLKGGAALATGGKSIQYLGLAEGGSGVVNKPTMMMIGEGGQPEAFNVQPLSKMGAGGMGHIGPINVYITETNPSASVIEAKIYMALQGLSQKGKISRAVLS